MGMCRYIIYRVCIGVLENRAFSRWPYVELSICNIIVPKRALTLLIFEIFDNTTFDLLSVMSKHGKFEALSSFSSFQVQLLTNLLQVNHQVI